MLLQQVENGNCLLGLSQLSVHHTGFDYKTPFHVESEIPVCFHLVLPRRSFSFFYSPLVDAEGKGGSIFYCIFLCGSCIESSLLSIFIKLYQKHNQSLIVFMASFRTATQFSITLNKDWFSTDKSSFCH